MDRIGDDERGADEEVADRQARLRLRRAVIAVPEALRATAVARYSAEASFAGIARLDAISEGAVGTRLRQAITLLPAVVGEEGT